MSAEETKPRQRASSPERETPTPVAQTASTAGHLEAADATTAPRPHDERGYQLDEHGLPLVGPARARALDGRPDPALSA